MSSKPFLSLLAIAFSCSDLQHVVYAQAPSSATTNEVLQLVTPDAVALLTVQPRAIIQDQSMQSLPIEVFMRWPLNRWVWIR